MTITTTHRPPNDLDYLLHKNPERFQSFDLSFGQAPGLPPEGQYREKFGLPDALRGLGGHRAG
jgi:hypothetical protein